MLRLICWPVHDTSCNLCDKTPWFLFWGIVVSHRKMVLSYGRIWYYRDWNCHEILPCKSNWFGTRLCRCERFRSYCLYSSRCCSSLCCSCSCCPFCYGNRHLCRVCGHGQRGLDLRPLRGDRGGSAWFRKEWNSYPSLLWRRSCWRYCE